MNREQLLSNLGTIASSGTRKFMEAMKESKGDANLIGQVRCGAARRGAMQRVWCTRFCLFGRGGAVCVHGSSSAA